VYTCVSPLRTAFGYLDIVYTCVSPLRTAFGYLDVFLKGKHKCTRYLNIQSRY
jgi:hypothetical protein